MAGYLKSAGITNEQVERVKVVDNTDKVIHMVVPTIAFKTGEKPDGKFFDKEYVVFSDDAEENYVTGSSVIVSKLKKVMTDENAPEVIPVVFVEKISLKTKNTYLDMIDVEDFLTLEEFEENRKGVDKSLLEAMRKEYLN